MFSSSSDPTVRWRPFPPMMERRPAPPPRHPVPTLASGHVAARTDGIARAFVQARAAGAERGWSVDECDVPSAAANASADTLAEERVAYLASLAPPRKWWGAGPRSRMRNPWRACEIPLAQEPLLGFEPRPGWRWRLEHGACGPVTAADGAPLRRLWLADDPQDPFPVLVRPLPQHCVMRVTPVNDTLAGPLLLRAAGQWEGLAQAGSSVSRGALRRHAVTPFEPPVDAVVHAGDRTWRRDVDGWRRVHASTAATVPDAPLAANTPLTFGMLLDALDDASPLRIAEDVAYVPIRDARGRFWLRAGPTPVRVAQVADERAARCLPARFVHEEGEGEGYGRWRQVARASVAAADGAPRAPDERAVTPWRQDTAAPGPVLTRGFASVAANLPGPRRCDLRQAARIAERILYHAVEDLTRPERAREALRALLAAWPARLHARVCDRVRATLQDAWRGAARFHRGEGDMLALVDAIDGGAWFLGTPDAAYVTSAVAGLAAPESTLARRLADWFVSRTETRDVVFPPLPSADATLERAGRFAAYDPTLMQEMLTWPERRMVLAAIAALRPGWTDIPAVEIGIAVPRRGDLLSDQGVDNLAIVLHDRATVETIVDALRAAAQARGGAVDDGMDDATNHAPRNVTDDATRADGVPARQP